MTERIITHVMEWLEGSGIKAREISSSSGLMEIELYGESAKDIAERYGTNGSRFCGG